MSTNFGLSRLNPETWEVKNLHRGHGLQGEEFNYSAYHRAANGKLYFGGANGYNAFYPNEVQVSSYAPNIVMTSFPQDESASRLQCAIRRPADDRTWLYRRCRRTLLFAALDFTEPAQNRYSHMLEGFDAGWADTRESRQVTYTNLDAGDYVLRVKAITSDGVESSAEFRRGLSASRPLPGQHHSLTSPTQSLPLPRSCSYGACSSRSSGARPNTAASSNRLSTCGRSSSRSATCSCKLQAGRKATSWRV